ALTGLPVDAHVGDLGQPPGGHLVEVGQRAEGAAAEQVGLGVIERPFHLPLSLGAPRPAGDGPEAGGGGEGQGGRGRDGHGAVVGGEGEEGVVIDGHVAVVAGDHHLEVVVQAGGGHAAEVLEGAHVLPQGRLEVLASTKRRYWRRE